MDSCPPTYISLASALPVKQDIMKDINIQLTNKVFSIAYKFFKTETG
jgi:hypothetical protein